MFVDVEAPDAARLIAATPGWPTPDELRELTPPAPPADDDRPGDGGPVEPAPFDVEPSGWLALDLDATTTDPRTLSDAQLIEAMTGFNRVAAWAQARQTRVVAELERRRPGSASRYTPDEVALALSMSRFAATGLLERSRRLVDTLHDTLAAFEAGRVDGFTVRLICDAVRYLDDAQAEWVQDQVLAQAPHQSVAQLRAALARAVIAVDPEGANTRHRRARKDRRVGVGQEQDGMATVWASLAAHDAQQVFGTLTGLARSLGAEDPRGMDARRADLLVGLMTGEISIAHPVPDGPAPGSSASGGVDHSAAGDGDDGGGSRGGGGSGCDTATRQHYGSSDSDHCESDDHARNGDDELGAGGDGASGGESAAGRGGNRTGSDTAGSGKVRSDETGGQQAGGQQVGGQQVGGDGTGGDGTGGEGIGGDGTGSGQVGAGATADIPTTRPCPVCEAQSWRESRPRVRPVNPMKPLVQVLMAHSTLRGIDDAPAELVGYGAICAEQARRIAADAVWKRLVYDDLTGAVLDHGRRTYRPPAALADHGRARDVYCRSPLCRRRAMDSGLDHTVPFPHGPTAEPNLAAVCLLHHDEKHAPGWTVLQHPDGRIDWIAPTGHVYPSEVHDYRLPDPPPLPSTPGPVADRTEERPVPRARGRRGGYDWTDTGDHDPAPF